MFISAYSVFLLCMMPFAKKKVQEETYSIKSLRKSQKPPILL